MLKPNNNPGKMTLPRALELLNALIDHMISDEGGHPTRAIPTLLEVGFTAAELTEAFCFPEESVKAEAESQKGDDNE